MIDILYSDGSLAVLVKQPGCLSQPDESGAPDALTILKERLGGEAYPVHRLDRNVGGILAVARTKEAAAILSGAIAEKESFIKEYMAVVPGNVENDGTFCDLLYKNAKEGKAYVVKTERKGVKKARLDYRILAHGNGATGEVSLLSVRLYTGRFHQIRVQFASRKMPLLGDGKYGSRDHGCEVALWASGLTLEHPTTGKRMHFDSLPDQTVYPWNCFEFKSR